MQGVNINIINFTKGHQFDMLQKALSDGRGLPKEELNKI